MAKKKVKSGKKRRETATDVHSAHVEPPLSSTDSSSVATVGAEVKTRTNYR